MAALDVRLTAFSFRRQRLDGSAPDALAAIEAAVAVYASNPSGPLSVLARASGVTAAELLALEPAGRVARGRAMRTSAFLMPAAHAPLVLAATAQPLERFAWMLRAAGVGPDGFEEARAAVLAAAGEPRTARELRARVVLDGVDVPRLASYLALRGDLVTLGAPSLSSNEARYVARPSAPGPVPDPAAARAWLAGAYLRSFGPARPEDLAWWAGWSRAATVEALGAHQTVDVGDGRLLAAADLAEFEGAAPLPADVVLIPKWDAWSMGYPLDGRERLVDRDVHDRLYDGDGNALGAVLVAGRAVGAWVHRGVRRTLEADLDLFDAGSPAVRQAIGAGLERIAVLLGYRDLRVRDVPTVVPDRRRQRRPLVVDAPADPSYTQSLGNRSEFPGGL